MLPVYKIYLKVYSNLVIIFCYFLPKIKHVYAMNYFLYVFLALEFLFKLFLTSVYTCVCMHVWAGGPGA